jgi:Zn-dependent peptidase ImmA (M78 family)/transcriptional regulator with XRE-family HTH domain
MTRAENINSDILGWARQSAGLSLEEAAERLGLSSSERASAIDKLADLERGAKKPTRSQLLRFAQVYRRPLITFYMKAPPGKGERGEDFRTLTSAAPSRGNANLDALLRDVRARQEMVRSLLEDEEDSRPLAFVGSVTSSTAPAEVAGSIARVLGFDPMAPRKGKPDNLFRELRSRAEAAGVFVLLIGDLGSHHSASSETVFRGFVIADKLAPFVIINDQDASAARSFTLIHELAHIWIGRTGVSGAPDEIDLETSEGRIEQFCNDVAGEVLLPAAAMLKPSQALLDGTLDGARAAIAQIAAHWSVSEPMVAYRLNRMGRITQSVYRDLAGWYAARWRAARASAKEKTRESENGPNYYVVRQFKLGGALIDVVRRTLRENLLSHTKAAKVLGVKTSSVEPLLRNLERAKGAFTPDARG